MKKALVIGGNGKVGGYLCPLLLQAGYQVKSVSRSGKLPPAPQDGYEQVEAIRLDRGQEGFEAQIAALGDQDVVVDMICFQLEDMERLVRALRGRVGHYLVCGSAWMHGHSSQVPVREEEDREPLCEYGRQKSAMDRALGELYGREAFPGTAVHPGHIVCPNTWPINPQGHNEPWVFAHMRQGKRLTLPNLGMETLHHVHAADVAGVFLAAIRAGGRSFGQGYHAVSDRALTLRGYASQVYAWYGYEPRLDFLPVEEWGKGVSEHAYQQCLDHIRHSPSYSMEKAREQLGFLPKFSSLQAVRECLQSLGAL